MAIITSLPGLSACIKVSGVRAEEYNIPDGEDEIPRDMTRDSFDLPKTYDQPLPYVARYIEAKPNQPYEFCVTKKPHFRGRGHHIACKLSRDGDPLTLVHEPYYDGHSYYQPQSWNMVIDNCCSGNPTSGYESHFFQFATFDIVEAAQITPEDLKRQMAVAGRCGTLKIFLYHMRKSGLDNSPMISGKVDHQAAELAEKAAKGKAVDCFTTHTTKPLNTPVTKGRIDKYKDDMQRPFAVFEFRYRTREGLMREGVIPRPTIAEQVEGMSNDEIRQRLTQVMEANERSATVSPGPKDTRRIKREAEEMDDDEFMARYKARRLENGKLQVDLSDD